MDSEGVMKVGTFRCLCCSVFTCSLAARDANVGSEGVVKVGTLDALRCLCCLLTELPAEAVVLLLQPGQSSSVPNPVTCPPPCSPASRWTASWPEAASPLLQIVLAWAEQFRS